MEYCQYCQTNAALCFCECSKYYMCDDCFKMHKDTYTNYLHVITPVLPVSTPNIRSHISSLFYERLQKTQMKTELLCQFSSSILAFAAELTESVQLKDNENMSTFFEVYNQKAVTAEVFKNFSDSIRAKDHSFEIVSSSKIESQIKEAKNKLFNGLKALSPINYCKFCYKLTDIVKLECSCVICGTCLLKLVADHTEGLYVLNELESAKKGKLKCVIGNCGVDIDEKIYKELIPDYEEKLKAADDRMIFTCLKCKTTGKKDVFQTACCHYCEECTIDRIRDNELVCNECETRLTENEIELFRKKTNRCIGCDNECNWIKLFYKRLCKHLLCISCLNQCKDKVCFFDCPKFAIGEADFIKIIKVKCTTCPIMIYKDRDFWINKNCQCVYCEDCQLNLSNGSTENCFNCGVRFNEFSQQAFIERKKENDNPPTKECPVCIAKVKVADMISLMNCIHEFCINCFQMQQETLASDLMLIKDLDKCMICKAEINVSQMDKFTNPDFIQKFNNYKLLSAGVPIVECPKCRFKFEPGFQRKIVCLSENCKFSFCKQCNDQYHEDGNCQEVYIQQRIAEMQSAEGGVTQCPHCRMPYIKDPKNCEHVDCIMPGCGISFCFQCACIRSPTMEHGTHYHRSSCKFFNAYDGKDDKPQKKCTECVRLGVLCKPPKDLRTPRLIAIDEVE